MQVKKYQAKTIREATARIKDILGPEAMIVSTKKLSGNNGNNLFEVAAVPASDDFSDRASTPYGDVKSELMSIKEMIYILNHSGRIIERLMMNTPLLNFYVQFIRSGISDYYTKFFFEKAGALDEHHAAPVKNIKENIIKEIMQAVDIKNIFKLKDKKRIIAAFVGTTGVGKTTTIAKLSALLRLKANKKVGLISIDNYRIGALEQLKTYANILGIPFFPAFNKKDLLFSLRRMEGRDVVLIDTAGQSQYDSGRIEELKRMMTDDLEISSHLLLSVSTTESEMNRTAINFSPLRYHSYIFTKIDEAERCGSIINQIMKLGLPISYITNGQNVPEDIEKASKKKILNLLLNLKN
ncbi:MAG: hypothetical protein SV375_00930 [Thermodesulfobacteriota bacterium]|nr:hypothetical protein [Thermodesulfobacteriota bacterium]